MVSTLVAAGKRRDEVKDRRAGRPCVLGIGRWLASFEVLLIAVGLFLGLVVLRRYDAPVAEESVAAPSRPSLSLRSRTLDGAQVTDAVRSTPVVERCLHDCTLDGTSVSHAGVARLEEALPNCEIW
ncbi:MAG: hypothetical protein AAGF11_42130 [Myxococcota bacterium]